MKPYLILSILALAFVVGCSNDPEPVRTEAEVSMIDWSQDKTLAKLNKDWDNTRSLAMSNKAEIETLKKQVNPRAIPQIVDNQGFEITPVSFSKSIEPRMTQDQVDALKLEMSNTVDEKIGELSKSVSAQNDSLAQQMKSVVEAVKSIPAATAQAPAPVQQVVAEPMQTVESTPTPVYSAPAYSGPKTYGAARTSGYKTVRKTRRVAKTVYEEVPYEEKVPVMKRPVYQTQQKQVPYQATKTVMTTETRTRKVPVTTYVDQPYQVSVPKTVTETKYRTVTEQVQVGEEEVPYSAPPQYAAAPIQYSTAPAVQECVQCQPMTSTYQAPQTSFFQTVAPMMRSTPMVAAVQDCTPVSQVFSSPMFQSSTPMVAAPAVTFSAAPAQPVQTQTMMRMPVVSTSQRAQRLRPMATAVQAGQQVRQQNYKQGTSFLGGGLFRGGKSQQCDTGR